MVVCCLHGRAGSSQSFSGLRDTRAYQKCRGPATSPEVLGTQRSGPRRNDLSTSGCTLNRHEKEGPMLVRHFGEFKETVLEFAVHDEYSLLFLSIPNVSRLFPTPRCSSHASFPGGPGKSSLPLRDLYTCYCFLCPAFVHPRSYLQVFIL